MSGFLLLKEGGEDGGGWVFFGGGGVLELEACVGRAGSPGGWTRLYLLTRPALLPLRWLADAHRLHLRRPSTLTRAVCAYALRLRSPPHLHPFPSTIPIHPTHPPYHTILTRYRTRQVPEKHRPAELHLPARAHHRGPHPRARVQAAAARRRRWGCAQCGTRAQCIEHCWCCGEGCVAVMPGKGMAGKLRDGREVRGWQGVRKAL